MSTPPDHEEIDTDQLAERKAFLRLSVDDELAVAELRESFERIAPRLIEDFYTHLLAHAPTAAFLHEPGLIERLKELQTRYFEELVSGSYDVKYARKRLQVGRRHQQIGLEPQWYLGAYNTFVQKCFPAFAKSLGTEVPPQLLSLLKVILLDIGLTLETYFEASMRRLRRHNEVLEETLQMYFNTEMRARQYAKLAGHEIRGSLNVIGSALDEVIGDFADEIPGDARLALEAARTRCLHATQVVEGILTEPEHNGQFQWVETNELLGEVRDRMPVYADGHDVRLTLPRESVQVWGDPVSLREVFANLVANAAHHLDKPRGEILVEHRANGDQHVFSVVDNGPGIPPEQQQRIFKPFYRLGSAHTGRGLGLYFVRRIVEQHGGEVWVESVVGNGSRFSFSLPTEPETRQQQTRCVA